VKSLRLVRFREIIEDSSYDFSISYFLPPL